VKGVTYCGTSTAAGAGLSMGNVPFYEEVQAFVLSLEAALLRRGLEYGIAAEHAHSCCVLLADRGRFFKRAEGDEGGERKWHTLIDYAAFFRCLESLGRKIILGSRRRSGRLGAGEGLIRGMSGWIGRGGLRRWRWWSESSMNG